jgi:hypothetical protein
MCGLLVSSCASTGRIQPQFPAAADVEASQEAKPRPSAAIVSNPVARAQYRVEVESWGDRVSDAAVRVCRSMNDMGGNFACGETSTERMERLAPG